LAVVVRRTEDATPVHRAVVRSTVEEAAWRVRTKIERQRASGSRPAARLHQCGAGEVCVSAKAQYADTPTLNRHYFDSAVAAGSEDRYEDAVKLWRACLETGDLMAHYGLGYTLYELGDFRGAYRHLRAYTEITPDNGWAQSWLGRTCIALGERDEARSALQKAIALEEEGGDAPELLAGLT